MEVFKYGIPITIAGLFTIELPKGAKILTAQGQHNHPQMWALVDDKSTKETRRFLLVGTGDSIDNNPETLDYIGTFQLNGGASIKHLFEIKK